MSPADNAAREPSMDEILASIRRIIEDNDAGHPQAAIQKDVLAQVSHAFLPNDVANRPQLNAVVNKEYAPEAVEPEISALPASDVNYDLTEVPEKPTSPQSSAEILKPHQIVGSKNTVASGDGPDDVFAAAVDKAGADIVNPSDMGTNLANMISNQAAERVSASFGALSEAVDSNKSSQLTSMTEEMLQPMLREWLDNNLPVIVERLVREEIERLARGEM